MWTFFLGVIFGILASGRTDEIQVNSRGCSFVGVFLAEGAGRHSLTFDMAKAVCEQLETIMATREQVEHAYNKSMQTCRYGWISDGSIVILRQTEHENCAKNMTGLIFQAPSTNETFDVYCYDENAGPKKNCSQAFKKSDQPATTELQPLTSGTTDPETTPTSYFDSQTEATSEMTNTIPPVSSQADLGEGRITLFSTFTTVEPNQTDGSGMDTIYPEENNTPPMIHAGTTMLGERTVTEEAKPTGYIPNDSLAESERQKSSSSDWLVVIVVILAVAAVLLVCAAVARRKGWCGRRQTLNITTKESGDGNGVAVVPSSSNNPEREQEMVTLMNKENIQENGTTEEFTVITLEESPDKDQQA
ncbi:CD44 antigen [Cyprinodon tularosa]|uniref:CD44 antigen n=1 Tax=Cyprinodon tularosa TaxID=77115 RepID=UPI0018E22536|nr:CD44 antigen [Cyprinodon tularosa]